MLQASGSTGKRRNGSHSQTLSGLNPVFATYKLFFFLPRANDNCSEMFSLIAKELANK